MDFGSKRRVEARNAKCLVRLENAPEASAGGILLVDRSKNRRIGVVESAGPDSVLRPGDIVVRSEYDKNLLDDDRVFVDEDYIYCLIVETRSWPPGTTTFSNENSTVRREIAAFDGRLILLMDPLTEREMSIPEDVRKMAYLTGKDVTLRKATVLDAGRFWQGKHAVHPWRAGDRVWVRPDVYDALQVLPFDKDLPFVDVPEGQEIRIYKHDLATVSAQVLGHVEDEMVAAE